MKKTMVWVIKREVEGDKNILCDVKGSPMYWGSKEDAINFLKLINFSEEEIKNLIIDTVPIEECEIKRSIIEYEVRSTD